jgi:hypothetical protein
MADEAYGSCSLESCTFVILTYCCLLLHCNYVVGSVPFRIRRLDMDIYNEASVLESSGKPWGVSVSGLQSVTKSLPCAQSHHSYDYLVGLGLDQALGSLQLIYRKGLHAGHDLNAVIRYVTIDLFAQRKETDQRCVMRPQRLPVYTVQI